MSSRPLLSQRYYREADERRRKDKRLKAQYEQWVKDGLVDAQGRYHPENERKAQ